MKKKGGGIISIGVFCILILSVYVTVTNSWIAKDINRWQAGIMGNNKYYPIITIGCLFIPPAIVLMFLKLYINGRFTKK